MRLPRVVQYVVDGSSPGEDLGRSVEETPKPIGAELCIKHLM
jgi:hypothetical protein